MTNLNSPTWARHERSEPGQTPSAASSSILSNNLERSSPLSKGNEPLAARTRLALSILSLSLLGLIRVEHQLHVVPKTVPIARFLEEAENKFVAIFLFWFEQTTSCESSRYTQEEGVSKEV